MIKIFIGHDPREAVAYNVLCHSIISRSTVPASITALSLKNLGGLMWRDRNPLQSTDFSFSRFLTPFLCDFKGWAIFMDCDMLVLDDIAKLWELRDDKYAVMCVKHDHNPREDVKFLGAVQTRYEMKNWSSVMLFNCEKCTALTPEFVNEASGLNLHRFNWLENAGLIGEIPHRWNHLVDFDPTFPVTEISNLHYTLGGPYFKGYADCGYAREWLDEREKMLHAD
jgi:hypothetical protein